MDPSADPDERSPEKVLNILLVDGDDAALDWVGGLILRNCGARTRVVRASSAEDAAAQLDAGAIDICLADYRLSDAAGFDFIGGRTTHPGTAFVLLAEQDRKDWVYSALKHGAQDCVRKDRLDGYEVLKTIAVALFNKSRVQELTSAALRDSLTGLGNRALFNEQAGILIEQARRNREQLAVLFMDVDDLKPINDSLGHSAGDQLLTMIAGRMREAIRKSDVLARMGGDEFAAVLPRIQSPQTVPQIMTALTEAVEKAPYAIGPNLIRVGLSCGAAIFPDEAGSADELLTAADSRMYAAKAARRKAKSPSPPSMSWLAR